MTKIYNPLRIICPAIVLIFIQCKEVEKKENLTNKSSNSTDNMIITKSQFGITAEGDSINKFTISHASGLEMSVINYGGIITNLKVPNKQGVYEDVVLGFNNIQDYESENPYFGAIIGRYGNRIAKGTFSLEGKEYTLDINNEPNSLHGGEKGFDKAFWNIETEEGGDQASLILTYTSKDGEGGFPGNLETTVRYTLKNENELHIKYEATTDKKTIINLTQHSYFNLSGNFDKKILDHIVEINADKFLPVTETLIPTGELRPVLGTPFDFTKPVAISRGMEQLDSNKQLKIGPGFDHCWVLNDPDSGLRFAASAYNPDNGRFMEVLTTEPAMQFYIGNFLDGTLKAKGGGTYEQRTGFCMETQHYPDSPNQSDFPSTILEKGETYKSETLYKFSVK